MEFFITMTEKACVFVFSPAKTELSRLGVSLSDANDGQKLMAQDECAKTQF